MFSKFSENRAANNVEKCGGARGRRWQYGGALHTGLVRLHARKDTPAPVHPHARTPAHTSKYVKRSARPR
jgi:hypothetical protein